MVRPIHPHLGTNHVTSHMDDSVGTVADDCSQWCDQTRSQLCCRHLLPRGLVWRNFSEHMSTWEFELSTLGFLVAEEEEEQFLGESERGQQCFAIAGDEEKIWILPLRDDNSDGFGVDDVVARGWHISDEAESDWRGHAAAIARSIQLIRTRMQWNTLLSRLRQLDVELEKPDLWSDPVQASKISREKGTLAGRLKAVNEMESELIEQIGMAELAREEKDSQIEAEATEALAALRTLAKEKELAALLSGEHDECSCFLEVQAGAGGVESMDWASMLIRMYRMWGLRRGYEVSTIEEMFGEEAGIKRATIRLDGQFGYGYAKSEAGVHRLVRISPFDAGKRRHTSFAAVAVMPVLDESAIKIDIDESDLRIERYRAGGAGGQHVNKTESAVRIVHIPTGIVVQCQADRSQHRNKATALGVLQSRLYQMETARRAQASAQHTETLGDITWGNQIRSYVLQPYQMVKDLRTGHEVGNPTAVLDGDIDGFILSYLASQVRFGPWRLPFKEAYKSSVQRLSL
ncbi:hypothetical protein AXG93_1175s1190 [Marchantia polymorpha subsp. ruderalis]|uniref:Prokaryotic-type class I peptide chain release factors domain-containing protein n=1 Tax=Marchantia polymorpha subsp. ruderalis TaxID=1480154 RepID=A0A176VME9_MARPO|nr:hypothetical protein AXG93_1175s1190 [Marchantia polymorpha subsp. ruderalis]